MSTPEITIFTKSGGPLTKSIKLLKDGVTFRSNGADCRMWEGRARRQPVSGVSALAETISKLNPHQAIALGRLRDGLPSEIAITTKSKLGNGEAISRSLENFAFAPGVPAYALLDHDSKWMPEHVRRAIIAAGVCGRRVAQSCRRSNTRPTLSGNQQARDYAEVIRAKSFPVRTAYTSTS